MSYGYTRADSEASSNTAYARKIYANGSWSRTLSLSRKTDGTITLRYQPRSDVGARKYTYDLITYYPDDRKFKIDIDDLPISANLVRILNEYMLDGFNAVLRGGSILINGDYYLAPTDSTSLGQPSLFLRRNDYGGYYRSEEIEEEEEVVEAEPEFDPAKEIAEARKRAGYPAPDDLPDGLVWNNGALVEPYNIPIIEVEQWLLADDMFPGWQRETSAYLRDKSQMLNWLEVYPDRAINILHNTSVSNTRQNKVLAVYERGGPPE